MITTEPLRVSLNDLLSADSRGKWWLVGAGWSGNPLAELEASKTNTVTAKQSADKGHKGKGKEKEEVLLELARQQGMNTDVRRGIFVILMTSEVSISMSQSVDKLMTGRITCTPWSVCRQ